MINKLNLVLLLGFYFCAACSSIAQQPMNVDVVSFEKAMANKDIQVLDVRTIEEFNSGHLKDALLADWNKKDQFRERVAALDKSKPVYTYCLSGARSAAAANWLKENGFQAYNMEGGISAWKKAGKPVQALVKVKQISRQEFESMVSTDKVVLVDVGAAWCPPCRQMNPVIDSLANAGAGKFKLLKVDGGEQTELATSLNVEAFPSFIIYKNGKETWRKSGVTDPKEIARQL